jgi:hypothetical protein
MAEIGVNYVASGSESGAVVHTAVGAQVIGWVQITNGGVGTGVVAIYLAGSATHILVPPKSLLPGESFPFPLAAVLNNGDDITIDCDEADVTFHFAISES